MGHMILALVRATIAKYHLYHIGANQDNTSFFATILMHWAERCQQYLEGLELDPHPLLRVMAGIYQELREMNEPILELGVFMSLFMQAEEAVGRFRIAPNLHMDLLSFISVDHENLGVLFVATCKTATEIDLIETPLLGALQAATRIAVLETLVEKGLMYPHPQIAWTDAGEPAFRLEDGTILPSYA